MTARCLREASSADLEAQLDLRALLHGIVFMLSSLDSADGVDDFLLRRGITGERGATAVCPLSVYLSGRMEMHIFVADSFCGLAAPPGMVVVAHPKPLREFIAAFDRGAYPELEAEEPEPPLDCPA